MRERKEFSSLNTYMGGGPGGIGGHASEQIQIGRDTLEVLLDIRDLLSQKHKRKILTTEMTLTQAEQALLDKLDNYGE